MNYKKSKALVLLSGGLDSMLAARTLMEQGVKVTGLTFISNFFGSKKARKASEQLGIELKEVGFSDEHLKMVKNPKYGYGKNMNPCIDCHALMLRKAKEIMEREGYDFIATGEILGQRPMSQNKEALKIVAEYSGVGDKLVRPMSAKLLDETGPEKEGKVIRGRLHNIRGRSRERQRELVEKYGIKEYASPGGGCLLTDPEFSERLLKMFDCWPDCNGQDVKLLRYGRVFWLKKRMAANEKTNGCEYSLIVVGRNKNECEKLENLAKKGDVAMELKDVKGPLTVLRIFNFQFSIFNDFEVQVPEKLKMSEMKLGEEKSEEEILQIAGILTGWYSPKARGKKVKIKLKSRD
ncbi:MAG: tRNA 4-thiouridine(8) synthase ThiI [Patescibacteria group bacterium]